MATIKAIEGRSVHQIQSGQVIVDLCSVVKELVENSLDAGATSIDVRFKNNGFDSVEVQDNGGGINPEDYESIALKHTTSKLSTYDELGSLVTFGFRGEAISSMCAQSNFYIVTAREDEAPRGKKLQFATSGKLERTTVAACQKGTTVTVEQLFYNIPVRRKDLEKNLKREYKKVLDILQAYACISNGVRLSVSHQPQNGKKAVVFSTKGSQTTRDNIANIFGAKTLSAIIPLDLELELQPTTCQVLRDFHTQVDNISRQVKVTGHVSRPVFGEGRSTPDRQMFFVNTRPCVLPQIAKAFNEVYKQYNITQSPFIFANLEMDTHAYDVNVSPDKRSILLHDQTALLDLLKESLVKLFDSQDQTVPHSLLQASRLPSSKPLTLNKNIVTPLSKFVGRNLEDRENVIVTHGKPKPNGPSKDKQKLAQKIQRWNNASSNGDNDDGEKGMEECVGEDYEDTPKPVVRRVVLDFQARMANQDHRRRHIAADHQAVELNDIEDNSEERNVYEDDEPAGDTSDRVATENESPVSNSYAQPQSTFKTPFSERNAFQALSAGAKSAKVKAGISSYYTPPSKRMKIFGTPLGSTPMSQNSPSPQLSQRIHAFTAPGTNASLSEDGEDREGPQCETMVDEILSQDAANQFGQAEAKESISDDEYVDEDERRKRDEAQVEEMVRRAATIAAKPTEEQAKRASAVLTSSPHKDSTASLVRFLEITAERIEVQLSQLTAATEAFREEQSSAPEDEATSSRTSAEELLSLTINKSDFGRMRIIGQFNLGFILVNRPASDDHSRLSDEVFIIDQHASDEIYNFHRLSARTTLTPQPLVRPHPLELTAVEEETVLSHTTTLAKNGFNITVDESGARPVGQRCDLLTLPTSRDTVFNTRDLEELISLLSEASPFAGDVIRPSRVRKMLAMRACRSSIMVGKSLTKRGMEDVVRHMGEIDKPWNCPHGRPTMRHLATLGAKWGEWKEGDGMIGDEDVIVETDWAGFVEMRRETLSEGIEEDDLVEGEDIDMSEEDTGEEISVDGDEDEEHTFEEGDAGQEGIDDFDV